MVTHQIFGNLEIMTFVRLRVVVLSTESFPVCSSSFGLSFNCGRKSGSLNRAYGLGYHFHYVMMR